MNLKLLWYCTKNKPYLFDCYQGTLERCAYVTSYSKSFKNKDYVLNGKIVAVSNYEVEEVMTILNKSVVAMIESPYTTNKLSTYYFLKRSCLKKADVDKYKPNYAIHIKNLEIFDKPKELYEYYPTNKSEQIPNEFVATYVDAYGLKKAPQNMCYVYDKNGNKYVAISVHPEWLAMILNGLKDVELRKKVLKEML